jgi:hypothetical protein
MDCKRKRISKACDICSQKVFLFYVRERNVVENFHVLIVLNLEGSVRIQFLQRNEDQLQDRQ